MPLASPGTGVTGPEAEPETEQAIQSGARIGLYALRWHDEMVPAGAGSLRWAREVTGMENDSAGASPGRKPMRRRRVTGGRRHRHVVRVTAEEEGQLLALALRFRVSVPKLLVDSALAGGAEAGASNAAARSELLVQLFGVHRAVGAVGNNLNQLTRAANATGEVDEDIRHTLAAVREVLIRLDAVTDEVGAS